MASPPNSFENRGEWPEKRVILPFVIGILSAKAGENGPKSTRYSLW